MAARPDRNQRQLAELLSRPGNDACADCKSRAPRWSSWNIGIFICVHCASIHRKMGTHISKVKSVTLDTWTKEQVESIRAMGNTKANEIFNPDERRNPPPTNSDETDRGSEMENYIRNKYQYRRFMAADPAAPPPVVKDPVPSRSGGASLGSENELASVVRLQPRVPSRAKSTPIVSSTSSESTPTRLNVLSSPSPPLPPTTFATRTPVFSSGLPYRPSTASALERPPSDSLPSRLQPQTQATPSPQPPLQYLPTSASFSTAPPSSNPLWEDMMSLSVQNTTSPSSAPGASLFPNQQGVYGSSLNVPTSASAFRAPTTDVQRSFSLPVPSSTASSGISAFGGPNGMTVQNPFSNTGQNLGGTGTPQYPQSTFPNNPFHNGLVNSHATGYQPSSYAVSHGHDQSQQQPFGYSGMLNSVNTPASTGSTLSSFNGLTPSSSPFSALASTPSYQQSYQMTSNSTAPTFSAGPVSSPFQSMLSPGNPQSSVSHPMGSSSLFGSMGNTSSTNLQQSQSPISSSPFGAADSQSSFAQSMLPAHMKNSRGNTTGTNPFGNGWNSGHQQPSQNSGYGGSWAGMR